MFIKLLNIVNRRQIINIPKLSQKMQISEKMLDALIAELIKTKCLEVITSSNSACTSCLKSKAGCVFLSNSPRLLRITEKGKLLITK